MKPFESRKDTSILLNLFIYIDNFTDFTKHYFAVAQIVELAWIWDYKFAELSYM